MEPLIAERVATCDLMMALVSAGFALGLAGAAHIAASREPGIVARPLASRVPPLTTYLLRLDGETSDELARFIERVQAIELPEAPRPMRGRNPDPPEDRKSVVEGKSVSVRVDVGGGSINKQKKTITQHINQ